MSTANQKRYAGADLHVSRPTFFHKFTQTLLETRNILVANAGTILFVRLHVIILYQRKTTFNCWARHELAVPQQQPSDSMQNLLYKK